MRRLSAIPFQRGLQFLLPWPQSAINGELRLAFVGRLHPASKGQDILLEALAGSQWRLRNWRLTLYGEGPVREGLARMASRLGLQNWVVLAGYETCVKRIGPENHVLVMPSRAEGLPLAIIEAMLCARPVVATDVAGHAEVVKDGVTGFLADAPTASSVAKALEMLWARREDLEAMGKAAAVSIRELVPPNPVRLFTES